MLKEPRLPLSIYASSAFINLMGLGLPLTILHIYDRVLPHEAFNTLALLVIGLISLFDFNLHWLGLFHRILNERDEA